MYYDTSHEHDVVTGYMSYYLVLTRQVCVVPKSAGFSILRFKFLGPPWGQILPCVGGWVA